MDNESVSAMFGSKGAMLYEYVLSFRHRFSKTFPQAVLPHLGHFLLACTPSLFDNYSIQFLFRLLLSFCKLAKSSSEQRIHVKVLEAGTVYSICLSCHRLHEYEFFQESHMLKAIESLIPGIKTMPGSYFSYIMRDGDFFHLQIKKIRGGSFSSSEKKALEERLSFECEERIGRTSPALVVPGNEEDLFKHIRHLGHELKFVHDLPQVMITFVEYSQKTLKFLVILLRVITPATLSISSLKTKLPSLINFSLEHLFCVDKLRKKYPKEAAVFTLEIDSLIFLRNNNEVNLRAARQYIMKALESMLGPYRDYNGGLLIKENEQLLAIKRLLEKRKIPLPSLLESFFYDIKPMAMRSLISAQTGCEIAVLLKKMLEYPLTKKYHLEACRSHEIDLVFVKTTENAWKSSFPNRILAHSPQVATASLEHEGLLYMCFFHQDPQRSTLEKTIRQELEQHLVLSLDHTSSVLRINFQGGDPPSLNPKFATDIQGHILSTWLFEGLTHMNRVGVAEMALAQSIEISSDKTLYTFHLRPSCWSNGEKVTAFDFERTWKKAILTGPLSMRQDCFHLIKNVSQARQKIVSIDAVGISVKDAQTLCVQLEEPCSYFLNLVATPSFFPLQGDSEEPIHFNGPFIMAKWEKDHLLYLSLNPFYWNSSQIKLAGIKIFMIKDPKIAYQMFRNGELDFVGDPISPIPPEILQEPEIQKELVSKSVSRVFWIHCNVNSSPLNNTNLRKALSLALNRQKLTEHVFIKQMPSTSPLPPKYSFFKGKLEESPKKALELFNLALTELKLDRTLFPTLVITHSGLSFERILIEELKMQWHKTLGIDIVFKKLPWNEFASVFDRGDFQIGGIFRRDLFNHAMSYLSFFKKSFKANYSWGNQEFDRLLDKERDIKKMENILIREAPVIPLINQRYLALVSEHVKGFGWNEDGCLNLSQVYIDEKNIQNDTRPFSSYTFSGDPHARKNINA